VKSQNNDQHCNICGRNAGEVDYLLRGLDGNICNDCIMMCYKILHEDKSAEEMEDFCLPTPREIKAYLDQYVISQETGNDLFCGCI